MTEEISKAAFMHPLAKKIVKLTSIYSKDEYSTATETNLLSLLTLYINRTTSASQFSEVIKELKNLLENVNTLEDLKKLIDPLSEEDADVKKIWENDAFFLIPKGGKGWEDLANRDRLITLLVVKKRIDYLYNQFIQIIKGKKSKGINDDR